MNIVTPEDLAAYCAELSAYERGEKTIAKYRRDLAALAVFLDGQPLTPETAAAWKAHLLQTHSPRTVNASLAALNGFCRFKHWPISSRYLRIQHQPFRETGRELTREEYDRLLAAARQSGEERLALLMETLCATGIRIGELKYITVEVARRGRATVNLKGKVRTILLPSKLCRKLLHYAGRKKITSGEIFLTQSGRSLTRRQVWFELKRLCPKADVEESKVFPHNFRHLFATVFYASCQDIARLADVLGHSSIETTRIYLSISADEQMKQLERLDLVS